MLATFGCSSIVNEPVRFKQYFALHILLIFTRVKSYSIGLCNLKVLIYNFVEAISGTGLLYQKFTSFLHEVD